MAAHAEKKSKLFLRKKPVSTCMFITKILYYEYLAPYSIRQLIHYSDSVDDNS